MVLTVLPEAVIAVLFCNILVTGKDALESFRPQPDYPKELNSWLRMVQLHKDDFRMIREAAKEDHVEKRNILNLDIDNEEDDTRNEISDEPTNDIYPYMYKNKNKNVGMAEPKYPSRLTGNNAKNPLRLRRHLDNDEYYERNNNVNIKSRGRLGELARSENKYPDRFSNIKRNANEDGIPKKDAYDENKSKREIQIDVLNDGKLVRKILEDNKDQKSIVLNIQSFNNKRDSVNTDSKQVQKSSILEGPVKFEGQPQAELQMKDKESLSNFKTLFNENEKLNTDISIARDNMMKQGLAYHVTIPQFQTLHELATNDASKMIHQEPNNNNAEDSEKSNFHQNNFRDMSKFWTPTEKVLLQTGIKMAQNNKYSLNEHQQQQPEGKSSPDNDGFEVVKSMVIEDNNNIKDNQEYTERKAKHKKSISRNRFHHKRQLNDIPVVVNNVNHEDVSNPIYALNVNNDVVRDLKSKHIDSNVAFSPNSLSITDDASDDIESTSKQDKVFGHIEIDGDDQGVGMISGNYDINTNPLNKLKDKSENNILESVVNAEDTVTDEDDEYSTPVDDAVVPITKDVVEEEVKVNGEIPLEAVEDNNPVPVHVERYHDNISKNPGKTHIRKIDKVVYNHQIITEIETVTEVLDNNLKNTITNNDNNDRVTKLPIETDQTAEQINSRTPKTENIASANNTEPSKIPETSPSTLELEQTLNNDDEDVTNKHNAIKQMHHSTEEQTIENEERHEIGETVEKPNNNNDLDVEDYKKQSHKQPIHKNKEKDDEDNEIDDKQEDDKLKGNKHTGKDDENDIEDEEDKNTTFEDEDNNVTTEHFERKHHEQTDDNVSHHFEEHLPETDIEVKIKKYHHKKNHRGHCNTCLDKNLHNYVENDTPNNDEKVKVEPRKNIHKIIIEDKRKKHSAHAKNLHQLKRTHGENYVPKNLQNRKATSEKNELDDENDMLVDKRMGYKKNINCHGKDFRNNKRKLNHLKYKNSDNIKESDGNTGYIRRRLKSADDVTENHRRLFGLKNSRDGDYEPEEDTIIGESIRNNKTLSHNDEEYYYDEIEKKLNKRFKRFTFVKRKLKAVDYMYDDSLIPFEEYDSEGSTAANIGTSENVHFVIHNDGVEGDYNDEEDPASGKVNQEQKKTHSLLLSPETATEDDDDYYSDEVEETPNLKGMTTKTSGVYLPDDKASFGKRSRFKTKGKVTHPPNLAVMIKKTNKVEQKNREPRDLVKRAYKEQADFQQLPKFVINDQQNEEILRKRSLANKNRLQRKNNFPMASKDFFVKQNMRKRTSGEKTEEPASSSTEDTQISTTVITTESKVVLNDKNINEVLDASTESPVVTSTISLDLNNSTDSTSTDSTTDAPEEGECPQVRVNQVCTDEDVILNATRPHLSTVLPIVGDAQEEEVNKSMMETPEVFERLDEAISGSLPSKIVEAMFSLVKQQENLRKRFSIGLKRNPKPLDPNATDTNNELSRKLLRYMSKIMEKLQFTTTCQVMPPILKHYLKQMTAVTKDEPLSRAKEMEEMPLDDNQNQGGNYIFKSNGPGENLHEKEKVLKELLERYNKLPDQCKPRAEPVKEYIENHLNMLSSMLAAGDSEKSTAKKAGQNIEETSKQSAEVALKGESRSDLVEEQLESVGLGKKNSFKPKFDLDQMIDNNRRAKSVNRYSDQKNVNKRDTRRISRSYSKLMDAIEKEKLKEIKEKNLGEIYGVLNEDYYDGDKQESEGDTKVNFESPVVFSLS